ncbi:MAG: PEP-CTERM sorting domain-containing protein [Planctomycetota bacterium]
MRSIPFPLTLLVFVVGLSLSCSQARGGVIFTEDFENSVAPEFTFTSPTVLGRTGTQGYSAHGFGSWMLRNGQPNAVTTLTLNGLDPHSSIDLGFSLGIIDSWDGSPNSSVSPDIFNVAVNGTVIFSESFDNFSALEQSYVAPAGVTLASRVSLGFGGGIFVDSAYDMSNDPTFSNIAHSSSSLTISWFTSGAGIQQFSDESWSIDNVVVSINGGSGGGGGGVVPEPASAAVWFGLGVFALVRKRRPSTNPSSD